MAGPLVDREYLTAWRMAIQAAEGPWGAPDAETDPMDLNHRDLMIRTRELIETTRREILQLREEIQSGRAMIDQSQKLLSRPNLVRSQLECYGKSP